MKVMHFLLSIVFLYTPVAYVMEKQPNHPIEGKESGLTLSRIGEIGLNLLQEAARINPVNLSPRTKSSTGEGTVTPTPSFTGVTISGSSDDFRIFGQQKKDSPVNVGHWKRMVSERTPVQKRNVRIQIIEPHKKHRHRWDEDVSTSKSDDDSYASKFTSPIRNNAPIGASAGGLRRRGGGVMHSDIAHENIVKEKGKGKERVFVPAFDDEQKRKLEQQHDLWRQKRNTYTPEDLDELLKDSPHYVPTAREHYFKRFHEARIPLDAIPEILKLSEGMHVPPSVLAGFMWEQAKETADTQLQNQPDHHPCEENYFQYLFDNNPAEYDKLVAHALYAIIEEAKGQQTSKTVPSHLAAANARALRQELARQEDAHSAKDEEIARKDSYAYRLKVLSGLLTTVLTVWATLAQTGVITSSSGSNCTG